MAARLAQWATARVGTARIFAALLACAGVWSGTGDASAADAPVAVDARLREAGARARLEFDLSETVSVEAFVLADPDRVVVELPEVNFQIDPSVGLGAARKRGARGRGEGLVESFRFGQFAPGKSRIVIDLARPARIERATTASIAGDKPSRLVLELATESREAFAAAAARGAQRIAAAAPERPLAKPIQKLDGAKPVVAIDPGHGGVDVGALGRSGLVEKELVFDFARDLARKIEAGGRYKAVLTRESDVFVALDERVRLARAAGAQLLVSVHADSLKDAAGVAGATVYTVSERASDHEAARLAESENSADRAAGAESTETSGDVADILFDLTRRETRAFAHLYSRTLVAYLGKTAKLNKNPNRSAGFKVLKAPDVPSVLLELGYLSSDKDAQAMSSPEWRGRAVAAVAQSIEAFLADPASRTPSEANGPVAASDVAEAPRSR